MDTFKIGSKVQWEGEDGVGIYDVWVGVIVAEGVEGVTVEFEKSFEGHDGSAFQANNYHELVFENRRCWFFDFDLSGNIEELIALD